MPSYVNSMQAQVAAMYSGGHQALMVPGAGMAYMGKQ